MVTGAPIRLSREGDEPLVRPRLWWVPWLLLALLVTSFDATFVWLSLERHAAFQSHAFDLGNMDQAVWNTLHGHPLRFTDMQVGAEVLTNRLAIHVEPLLVLFAPLYLLHSGPETLLVLQAIVVGFGAVPAFLIARRALRNAWMALAFPLAYLLHPSLQNVVLDDFHAVALATCFLLFALYFAIWPSIGPFAVFAVLALATKEDVGLIVALLGLLLAFRGRVLAGVVAMAAGAGWFLVAVDVIIPALNPARHSPYLSRYAYLGHGIAGIAMGVLRHPGVAERVLTSPNRLAFLDSLLHPMGYVSVLGVPVLLLSAPALVIDMLSSDATMYSGFYQYTAEILPFVIGAAAIGVGWITRLGETNRLAGGRTLAAVCCLLLVGAACVDGWRYGFTPIANGYVVPSPGTHQVLEARLLGRIPPSAVVAAADEIEPHLSDRITVYLLPTVHPSNGPPAQYVAMDASIPSLPTTPRTLHDLAIRLLDHGYGISAATDGVLILERHAIAARSLPPTFYSFAFAAGVPLTRSNVHWGSLRLAGYVVHPRDALLNRSRPAIGVQTLWMASSRLPSRLQIALYFSPVYHGRAPRFSTRWSEVSDAPLLDWSPPATWPVNRRLAVSWLPYAVDPLAHGKIDVALGVRGSGRAASGRHVPGDPVWLVRLATLQAGY